MPLSHDVSDVISHQSRLDIFENTHGSFQNQHLEATLIWISFVCQSIPYLFYVLNCFNNGFWWISNQLHNIKTVIKTVKVSPKFCCQTWQIRIILFKILLGGILGSNPYWPGANIYWYLFISAVFWLNRCHYSQMNCFINSNQDPIWETSAGRLCVQRAVNRIIVCGH